jgi:hypothetical protein
MRSNEQMMSFNATTSVRVLGGILLLIAMATSSSHAGTEAVHLVNDMGQRAADFLRAGGTFVTDYKGTNDVTISVLAGTTETIGESFFGGATPGNNPDYLKNFAGNLVDGTSDGTIGAIATVRTEFPALTNVATSLQFDFSIPLTTNDRMLVVDVDQGEQYQITAYHKVGDTYVPVSLLDWTHQQFSGATGITPNSTWATWDPADGLLTGNTVGVSLDDPLDVLIPDQTIDRIVFSTTANSVGGLASLQFVNPQSVPEPASIMLLGSAVLGLFAVVYRRR